MAEDLQSRIDSIRRKGALLVEQLRLSNARCARAEDQVAALSIQVSTLQARIDELERQLARISLAGPLLIGVDRPTYEQARLFLTDLVCEIDKCITELND